MITIIAVFGVGVVVVGILVRRRNSGSVEVLPIASVSPDLVVAHCLSLAVQRSTVYAKLIAQYQEKYECRALGFALEGDRGVVVIEQRYVCGVPYGGTSEVLCLARGTDKVFRCGDFAEYELGATDLTLLTDALHEEILEQARLGFAQPLG